MSATVVRLDPKFRFEHADVLLFDPIFANRTTLRTSLEMVGFRHITMVVDHREIPELVHGHLFDLVVADVTQNTERLCAMIRAMREGKAAANPFAHVVLLAWKLDNDMVRRALNCGADEFVTRPFSVAFLSARLKAATEVRQNFVVTTDYVGPDRRRDRMRRGGTPSFVAPNSLQVKCVEAYDASQVLGLQNKIRAAKERVGVDRIQRAGIDMPLAIRALKRAFTDMDALEPGLDALKAIAKDARERTERMGIRQAADVGGRLIRAIAGARSGVNVAANIDDAGYLATEFYLAINPGNTLEQFEFEIEQALAAPNARR